MADPRQNLNVAGGLWQTGIGAPSKQISESEKAKVVAGLWRKQIGQAQGEGDPGAPMPQPLAVQLPQIFPNAPVGMRPGMGAGGMGLGTGTVAGGMGGAQMVWPSMPVTGVGAPTLVYPGAGGTLAFAHRRDGVQERGDGVWESTTGMGIDVGLKALPMVGESPVRRDVVAVTGLASAVATTALSFGVESVVRLRRRRREEDEAEKARKAARRRALDPYRGAMALALKQKLDLLKQLIAEFLKDHGHEEHIKFPTFPATALKRAHDLFMMARYHIQGSAAGAMTNEEINQFAAVADALATSLDTLNRERDLPAAACVDFVQEMLKLDKEGYGIEERNYPTDLAEYVGDLSGRWSELLLSELRSDVSWERQLRRIRNAREFLLL